MSDSRWIQLRAEYTALTRSIGVGDLGPRSQIEITGRDRSPFLHGFCTNDIKRLVPGRGCEAFITNVQGRTVGYVYIFCGEDALVIDTSAGQAGTLVAHLERFRVREQLAICDRSDGWSELLVGGPQAADGLRQACGAEVPDELFSHVTIPFQDQLLSVRRVPFLDPSCIFVSGNAALLTELRTVLESAGVTGCCREVVEIRRVESGSPLFGVDISVANLPQELDRDVTAISFRKGCYLGQETVARLDAMGHVNWRLRGLKFPETTTPIVGSELQTDGKPFARITSVVRSVQLQSPLAMAFVRRGYDGPGSTWRADCATVEVVSLPLRG